MYPLLLDALDAGKISVGPPYFGTLFALLLVPLAFLLPVGFLTRWQKDQLQRLVRLIPESHGTGPEQDDQEGDERDQTLLEVSHA